MACVTSYFNSTLWHKSMHRFWPLWTVYLVGWLFLIPFLMLRQYFDYLEWLSDAELPNRLLKMVLGIPEMLQAGVWLSAGYGLLCAMAVFGYLYNNRSACMMHALPMRRESLFFTQYTAGVSYFLLPHLVAGVLGMAVCLIIMPSSLWYAAWDAMATWFLVQTAACLFFFSFAAFCAMFTGHVLALPAFYGILNILVYVLYELITALMSEFFYGFTRNYSSSDVLELFTPVYALTEAAEWIVRYNHVNDVSIPITWYMESPGAVAGYAVAGIALAAAALLVYQRRHIESAGDVVSVRIVRPIFRTGVAFCAGLSFGVGVALFFGWLYTTPLLILCVILCTAIGWFVAEMLLRKSFRVLKAWKGCVVVMAAMAVLCVAFVNDWFGVENKVPAVSNVTSLTVSMNMGAPWDSGSYLDMEITDPARIQTFIELHQAVIAEKSRSPAFTRNGHYHYDSRFAADSHTSLNLTYTLANGSTLQRRYHSIALFLDEVDQPDTVTWHFAQLTQDRDLVAKSYNLDSLEGLRPVEALLQDVYDRVDGTYVQYVFESATGEDLRALWDAVQADFAEGTLGKRYLFDNEERYGNSYHTDLHLTFALDKKAEVLPGGEYAYSQTVDEDYYKYGGTRGFTITLTPHARHTLQWIEEMEVLGDRFLIATHNMDTSGLDYEKPIPEGISVEELLAGTF